MQRETIGSFGRSVRRFEDRALVSGTGRYVDDIRIEGVLHLGVARSLLAHADITVDVAPARDVPGVVAAFDGDDLEGVTFDQTGVRGLPPRPVAARGRARYAGEPVAFVVAETPGAARDGAAAVEIGYERRPVVVDVNSAAAGGASKVDEALDSNVVYTGEVTHDGDPLEGADVVIRRTYVNQRVAPAMLEGRVVAAVPQDDGSVLVWASHQMPHALRNDIAAGLDLGRDRVRVIVPEVGGGFGSKASVYPEDLVAPWAALRLGRPVKFVEGRSEDLLTAAQGRGQVQRIELGAKRDGTLVGMRAEVDVDLGAYCDSQYWAASASRLMMSGPYLIPAVAGRVRGILTNTPPVGAYRGAGRPEAAYLLERAMDDLARELGIDPAELRRRNLIPAEDFPYETPSGAIYDSGEYHAALDAALEKIGYDDLRREQAARRAAGDTRHLGIGIGSYVELSAGGKEAATATIDEDGTLTVRTGTSPTGQGHRTTWAQIAADAFGIDPSRVVVVLADTGEVATGGGTGGSRSAPLGGSALLGAVDELAAIVREKAGAALEAAPEDIRLHDGVASVAGTDVGIEIGRLAAEAGGRLEAAYEFAAPNMNYPFGTHVCSVEVDEETGIVDVLRFVSVDDCGTVINPMVVEGQFQGGAMQGISQALFEEVAFDDGGTLLTGNFATYAIPTIDQAPWLESYRTETPSPNNPAGIKGAGEAGATGSTPAVANAVADALAHLGVELAVMPFTPERVWTAIRRARG